MRIDMNTNGDDSFVVERWWSRSPEFVVSSLQAQLAAATAIWPDLKQYAVGKKRPKTPETTA